MNEAQIAACSMMVIAAVAFIRRTVPKVDGWITLVVVAAVSAVVVYLNAPDGASVRSLVSSVIAVAIAAAGTNAFATKLAERSAPKTAGGGEVLVAGPATPGVPPAEPSLSPVEVPNGDPL